MLQKDPLVTEELFNNDFQFIRSTLDFYKGNTFKLCQIQGSIFQVKSKTSFLKN